MRRFEHRTSRRWVGFISAATIGCASVIFAAASSGTAAGPGTPTAAPDASPIPKLLKSQASAARLRAALDQIVAAGAPAAVAYVRDGSRRWTAAAGVADIQSKRTARVTDVWRVASVTKLIAAHLALALADEGRLDLDAPLSAYNGHLPQKLGRIRVRALLNHTSRIAEYLDHRVLGVTARGMAASARRRPDIDALVNRALMRPLVDDPMAEHQYANTNYVLLEHIIQQAAGVSFKALVRGRLIEPLDLKRVGFTSADGSIPLLHLNSYIRDDTRVGGPFSSRNKLLDVTTHPFFRGADGGLYASAAEIARLLDRVFQRHARDGAPLGRLTRTLHSDHDGFYRYGLGVMAVELTCKRTIYGHEGQDLGGSTLAFANRDNSRQLVLGITLSTDNNEPLSRAIERLRSIVFCS
ncbi:MAG: serine hydrolase domain-containing protein [Pseudomonadota bacterium]